MVNSRKEGGKSEEPGCRFVKMKEATKGGREVERKKNQLWTFVILLVGVALVAAMTVTWSAWAGNNEGKTPRPI